MKVQAWLSSETLLEACKLYPKRWIWHDCKEGERASVPHLAQTGSAWIIK